MELALHTVNRNFTSFCWQNYCPENAVKVTASVRIDTITVLARGSGLINSLTVFSFLLLLLLFLFFVFLFFVLFFFLHVNVSKQTSFKWSIFVKSEV